MAEQNIQFAGAPWIYYIGYGQQEQGRELINQVYTTVEIEGWREMKSGDGSVNWKLFARAYERRLFQYSYYVAGELSSREAYAQMAGG